jgi:hypothetical protein
MIHDPDCDMLKELMMSNVPGVKFVICQVKE